MKNLAVAVLRDCLAEDLESARQRLKELNPAELKELQRACMTLQNLAAARHYMLAQQSALGLRRISTPEAEIAQFQES